MPYGPPPQADVVDLAIRQVARARGTVGFQERGLILNAVEVDLAKRPEPLDGIALDRPLEVAHDAVAEAVVPQY